MRFGLTVALAVAFAPLPCADEVVLTDGRRISGTVVGMEKGSFRVETDYGVALIKKEKVARIEMQPAAPAPPPAVTVPAPAPVAQTAPAPAPVARRAPPAPQERQPPNGRIEERLEGSLYVNDSYRFEMFRPPNWKLLEATARSIPSAITALGTEDEATLMLVGSVVYDAPPAAYAAVLDSTLKKMYGEFEIKSQEETTIAGKPAIRRAFRGVAEGREWHGIVVNLADGSYHYGLIGLTSEEAHQFKASVLAKMIGSFRFR
jgi:hypothetical protein